MSRTRPSALRCRAAAPLMLTTILTVGCASNTVPAPTFTGFVQAQTAPLEPWSGFPGVIARRLGADEKTGRRALYLELPLGWRWSGMINDVLAREWYVLDGTLQAGNQSLGRGDLLFVPPGRLPPDMTALRPSRALLFVEPVPLDAGLTATFVTRGAEVEWRPGTVARDAGVPLDLSVKDLKRDPVTGARTWLVRVGPEVRVPWESHSVVEEGYLLEGDYRLAECLPGGRKDGEYLPGGYFWRPAGWIHSGPDSGTDGGAVWLIRSPAALDASFHGDCVPPSDVD